MRFIIEHLAKQFEQKQVLQDISFSFEEGKIYGVLGSNGARKTTLFNCLNQDIGTDGGKFYLETMTATGIKAKTEGVRIWLLKNKLQCVNLEHNTMEPELFVKEIGKIRSQIDSFVKKAKKCFDENIHKVNSVKEFKLGEVYWLQRGPYEIPNIVI